MFCFFVYLLWGWCLLAQLLLGVCVGSCFSDSAFGMGCLLVVQEVTTRTETRFGFAGFCVGWFLVSQERLTALVKKPVQETIYYEKTMLEL